MTMFLTPRLQKNTSPIMWCLRCGHAVVRGRHDRWMHSSDDDWTGYRDCDCVMELRSCSPRTRAEVLHDLLKVW